MEELAKALAQAVRTGSDLAWPALLLYIGSNVFSYIAFGGTVVGVVWLVCRACLRYPEMEAAADERKRQISDAAYQSRSQAELRSETAKHNLRMAEYDRRQQLAKEGVTL